jgi:tRNA A37 threonylcarbamoyladenosine synthetase subunit TsaC/SUA5/YrdC
MKTNLRRRIDSFERIQRAMSSQKATRVADQELKKRARAATRGPYTWVTEHTRTYNEHWIEEGRPSPYEPFPRHPYFEAAFELIDAERVIWFEKSRDMMLSWACVAYLTLEAQRA